MKNASETTPRIPWWVSAPLALLASGVFAYFSLAEGDPPWYPPGVAAVYRVLYGVLALLFLGGAAVALRGKPRAER